MQNSLKDMLIGNISHSFLNATTLKEASRDLYNFVARASSPTSSYSFLGGLEENQSGARQPRSRAQEGKAVLEYCNLF